MRGGLRHTSAQLEELTATQSWIRASGEALAYIIRTLPMPTDAREKQVRARVLLAIRNALRATARVRPSLAAEPVNKSASQHVTKSTSEPVAKPAGEHVETPPAAEAPPAPTPLRVDIVMPTVPVPDVRPGTTAGDPFTLERVAEAD